jgi:arginyl-tRNA synthetase
VDSSDYFWDFDTRTVGDIQLSAIREIFAVAIKRAFKSVKGMDQAQFEPIIARCGNAAHGDFQCNNALGLAKSLKSVAGYNGPKAPKDVADAIMKHLPTNSLVQSCAAAVWSSSLA